MVLSYSLHLYSQTFGFGHLLSCQIIQQAIWGNQTSVFRRETKAIRTTPSNSCHQNNNTNLPIYESSCLSFLFQRNKWPTSYAFSSTLLCSCFFSFLYLRTASLCWFLPIAFQYLPPTVSSLFCSSCFLHLSFTSQPTIFWLLVSTRLLLSNSPLTSMLLNQTCTFQLFSCLSLRQYLVLLTILSSPSTLVTGFLFST